MIGLCSSCAWWTFPAPSGMFVPAVADGFGVCELTRRDLGELQHPETMAIPADDEGNWNHVLATRADFGCVQFEPTEGKDA